MGDTAPSRAMDHDEQKRVSSVARGLLAGWDARADAPLVGTRKRKFNQQQLALPHALCAHVHYLAGPALDLLDTGKVLAALPLVRACFESALTAQWATQTTDGAPAFINEDVCQRRAHVQTLEKAVSQVFREAAPKIAANLINPLETSATAKGFHNLCNDLVPGRRRPILDLPNAQPVLSRERARHRRVPPGDRHRPRARPAHRADRAQRRHLDQHARCLARLGRTRHRLPRQEPRPPLRTASRRSRPRHNLGAPAQRSSSPARSPSEDNQAGGAIGSLSTSPSTYGSAVEDATPQAG